MEERKFSYSEALKFSFKNALDNFGLFVKLILVFMGLILIPVIGGAILFAGVKTTPFSDIIKTPTAIIAIAILVFMILLVASWYGAGYINVGLKIYSQEPVQLSDVFIPVNLAMRYAMAIFAYGLLVILGFILFIIPGFIFMIRYIFVPFLVVDQNLGIVESFTESSRLTQGIRMHIFWFWLLLVILSNSINMGTFGLGTLISGPLMLLAFIYVYKYILDK